ncbi:hypothetical protein NC653_022326 [Populus alba x Populus x berolinensis]|uniref:Uncharacterized protein n=1 Tax=Populus alba x Populus x berolinensis TaxID=444605 RepID=A0AAD6MGV8_9ROSI|nr:hypothetical protein NC653_022326 [Populus alba x Populus x berolinensis]
MLVSFQSGDRHKTSYCWCSEMDYMDLFLRCANGTWEDPLNCLQCSKLLPVHNARVKLIFWLCLCVLSCGKYIDVYLFTMI